LYENQASLQLTKYQGITRLKYEKGDSVFICSPFSNAKAFGFVLTSKTNSDSLNQIECGLIDLSNLDASKISKFSSGNRTFSEQMWKKITESIILNEDRIFDTEDDMWEIEKEEEESSKRRITVAYCTHDFNYHNNDVPLSFNLLQSNGWEESMVIEKVPFLSWSRNDIVITTRVPDGNNWLEGYKANDLNKDLGIIHKDFIENFKFRT